MAGIRAAGDAAGLIIATLIAAFTPPAHQKQAGPTRLAGE
jgi:hypothetical protein